jgi:hypothetical protein
MAIESLLPVLGILAIGGFVVIVMAIVMVLTFAQRSKNLKSFHGAFAPTFGALGFHGATGAMGVVGTYTLQREGRIITVTITPPRRGRYGSRPGNLILRITAAVPDKFTVARDAFGQAALQSLFGMHTYEAGPGLPGLRIGTSDDRFAWTVLQSDEARAILTRLAFESANAWGAAVASDGKVGLNVVGIDATLANPPQVQQWLDDCWRLVGLFEAAARSR